jgi:hypothetical protein
MAFGKDQSRINHMSGSWTQRAKSHATRRGGKGGGGSSFFWKGNYNPTESEQGDIIRVFDGAFLQKFLDESGQAIIEDTLPYVFFREHRDCNDRSCICSAGAFWGVKGKSDICLSCDAFWEDVAERRAKKARGDNTKGPNRMSCIDRFAWLIYDYGPYTKVYDVDQKGQVRTNQKGEPYTSWEKGHPHDMRFNGRAVEWKMGNLIPWVLTKTQNEWLMGESNIIGSCCATCGSRRSIICEAKVCAGCSAFIYDPNNTTFSQEQRSQVDNNPYHCQKCGHVGYVGEVLKCRGCQQPKRTPLFDVDIQLQKQKTGEKTVVFRVLEFSQPRPLQVSPDVLASLKPIDMLAKFAPTPPDKQREFMTLPASSMQQSAALQGQMPGFSQQPPMMPPQQMGMMGLLPQSQAPAAPQVGQMAPAFNPAQFGIQPGPQPMQQPTAPQGQPFHPPQFPGMPQQFGGQAVPYHTDPDPGTTQGGGQQ